MERGVDGALSFPRCKSCAKNYCFWRTGSSYLCAQYWPSVLVQSSPVSVVISKRIGVEEFGFTFCATWTLAELATASTLTD